MTKKYVYTFGNGVAEGTVDMKNLLGGKGANLAEMSNIGLPVPSGFTITTEVCTYYYNNNETLPSDLEQSVLGAIAYVEETLKDTAVKFGCENNPLLFSVRSGARVSMPGMMDTVLNLGLNDKTVEGLAACSNDARFAWDSYRRFIQMYSSVVLGVEHHEFEELLESRKDIASVELDTELSSDDLKLLVNDYKELVKKSIGEDFPQDVYEQLNKSIIAVFKSWNIPRAKIYREMNGFCESWGTAVNVQAMVFGNMGEDCATGVAFTRNPSTGENSFYGEYLINAQGEDVVAGIRTPQCLTIKSKEEQGSDLPSMEETMPESFNQLNDIRIILEKHYKDMQDIEFTIQSNKLFMLQTRSGKRTTKAALKIASDMVEEGSISKEEALLRIDENGIDQILHPMFDEKASKTIIGKGLPASPGAASGGIVFNSEDADAYVKEGKKCVLVRIETSPDDIHGMNIAQGILTTRGGMTSHAAVVARGMGRPCVSGAGNIQISYKDETMTCGDKIYRKGDFISIDGSKGEVMDGIVECVEPEITGDFETIMQWANEYKALDIRTNADNPNDAATAIKFGAEGIGLCRTEHMFFEGERIIAVREMILAESKDERIVALDKLLDMQKDDFKGIFKVMSGLPVTVRLLDPPLHEFLPHSEAEYKVLSSELGIAEARLKARVAELHEFNPMLGHRGCRLLNTYPEVCEMQARAILESSIEIENETGKKVNVEIMIPLVSTVEELSNLKSVIVSVADELSKQHSIELQYKIGTMIELPRAALTADKIAEEAEFFSFGTNDLTQTTFGISRDDSAKFIAEYKEKGIFKDDPFQTLDIEGVGSLVEMAKFKGSKVRKGMKMGICGEHGGDPKSIEFCHNIGLSYVSCSPFRVPIARIAAAKAAIKAKG